MTGRLRFQNRSEWLAGRAAIGGIGASEAAAALGESKWQSRLELWKEKTGRKEPDDLSEVEEVQRGIRMEGAVRAVFTANHPELIVAHHPFDILFQKERPWLFATLDGETVDRDGRHEQGIVEIKNVTPRTREDWEIWENGVPPEYYRQILHQHLATGRTKIWLAAFLYQRNGDIIYREYSFHPADIVCDAQIVLAGEELFMDYVKSDSPPPTPIKL